MSLPITEYQEHSGAVDTENSEKVHYAYSEMASSANHSRLTSMTYPDGRQIDFVYDTGLDSDVSRLSSIDDGATTLEAYEYLGYGTVVLRAHPEPDVDLTYIKQGMESNGDAGDQYTGLDRFGRVEDQRWIDTGTGSHTDRFKYGYDRNSNRLYRENVVKTDHSELYHADGASNGYDDLNQLTDFQRGTLNGAKDTISSESREQNWSFDALGNWSSVTTDSSTETRSHNEQNEITSISGATTPTYDSNGNMTGDETGKTLVFDAWNRLVEVKNGQTTLTSYEYDALNRRITEDPGTARALFDSAHWQVVEERESGVAVAQMVWSPVYVDAMILRDRDTDSNGSLDERIYVQQDANFNVTAIIDDTGSVVERFIYDPFGLVSFLTPSWGSRSASDYEWIYLHQGGRFDSNSGLYHFRYRESSPTLGRWVSLDPIVFAAGDANLYRANANAPAKNLDPSGLKVTKITINEVKKPLLGERGAVVWPVNFKLDGKADKCNGGWILQHVKTKATDKSGATDVVVPKFTKDYWEAWRVEPEATGPTPKVGTPRLVEAYKKIGIDIAGIKANDWFHLLEAGKGTMGEFEFVGEVYYLDNMKETDLPESWTTEHFESGELRGTDDSKSALELIKKYSGVGPTPHNLTVGWAKLATKTRVVKKTP